jgi:hypothetical protein
MLADYAILPLASRAHDRPITGPRNVLLAAGPARRDLSRRCLSAAGSARSDGVSRRRHLLLNLGLIWGVPLSWNLIHLICLLIASTMPVLQSQHIPMRSKTNALHPAKLGCHIAHYSTR